jgi:hypothetical protein
MTRGCGSEWRMKQRQSLKETRKREIITVVDFRRLLITNADIFQPS